jgi:hypothetical protein
VLICWDEGLEELRETICGDYYFCWFTAGVEAVIVGAKF